MMKHFLLLVVGAFLAVGAADPTTLKVTFSPDSASGWRKTKSAQFRMERDAVIIDGSGWDSKIWQSVVLEPLTTYQIGGEGRGRIMVQMVSSWSSQPIVSLNLSGEKWHRNLVRFKTPESGKLMLVLGINASVGRGEVRWLSIDPVCDNEPSSLDPVKLKSNRPSPAVVRGMTGYLRNDESGKRAAEWGINVIRVGFHVRDGKDGTPWTTILEREIDKLENQLKIAAKYQLKVVPVLCQVPLPRGAHDYKTYFSQPDTGENLIRIWRRVVERLKPYHDTIWGYDLLNEPLDRDQLPQPPREWRELAINIVKAIRSIDPEVWIIYEPGPGGLHYGFKEMLPLPDYRVIYSLHYYSPHAYTHQGIHDIEKTDLTRVYENTNIRYPGIIDGQQWDRHKIEATLQCVYDFQKKYPVPLFVGEFSAVRWAPGADAYLKDGVDIFEKNGWSWAYHAFNDWSGWNLNLDETYWIDAMGANHPNDPRHHLAAGLTARGKVIKNALEKNITDGITQ